MLALLPSIILTGCRKGIPNCDDPEIRELVVELVEDYFEDDANAEIVGAVIAEMDDIRMVKYDEKTKIRQCIGKVKLAGKEGQSVNGIDSRNKWKSET